MPQRLLACFILVLAAAAPTYGQIRMGLMVSATGPTSAIGIPQRNTGEILPRTIGGASVEYISLEDAGDTTRAVQNVKKLIQENNIDALIGPSTTPALLKHMTKNGVKSVGFIGFFDPYGDWLKVFTALGAKPGTEAFRVALRDALEREREVVGCQGVFNMSPDNHNGMDERARVLATVKDGGFRLLPQ